VLVGDHWRHNPEVCIRLGVRTGKRLQLVIEYLTMGAQGAQTAQA
jgi:hypothetical protein